MGDSTVGVRAWHCHEIAIERRVLPLHRAILHLAREIDTLCGLSIDQSYSEKRNNLDDPNRQTDEE